MTAVIIGPGATGGLLAATLVRSGVAVSLLCRDAARAARLRRSGIAVTGATKLTIPGRRFTVVSHRPSDIKGASAVFLCVKSYDAPAAIRAARQLSDGSESVVSLLNGLSHAPLFRKSIARDRAVFGVGYFSAWRSGPGEVHHAGGSRILVAEDKGGKGAAAAAVMLRRAGWNSAVAPSVDRLLWTKLALNAAINPLAALAGRPNGELESDPPLRELLERAAAEGESILKARGLRPLEASLPDFAVRLCRDTAGNVNSMLADLR